MFTIGVHNFLPFGDGSNPATNPNGDAEPDRDGHSDCHTRADADRHTGPNMLAPHDAS